MVALSHNRKRPFKPYKKKGNKKDGLPGQREIMARLNREAELLLSPSQRVHSGLEEERMYIVYVVYSVVSGARFLRMTSSSCHLTSHVSPNRAVYLIVDHLAISHMVLYPSDCHAWIVSVPPFSRLSFRIAYRDRSMSAKFAWSGLTVSM